MVYVKQISDGNVVALLSYNYDPEIVDDQSLVVISEEEYNELLAEMQSKLPKADPNRISDRKALEIITGGEV